MWELVIADFRERTRRYSYLITLMISIFLGYLVLTGKYSYLFGPFKPVNNSHWVGTTVALAGATIFTLVGFYIVRTSISRDRDTGVGEILATTNLSSISYLLAKFISNLLVLWSMVAALYLMALLGVIVFLPSTQINLFALLLPFMIFPMIITFPVAGAAILFDTVSWLRGAFGNIIYFFFAEALIISGLLKISFIDAAGLGLFESSIRKTITTIYPGEPIPMTIGFVGFTKETTQTIADKIFLWEGIDWTLSLLMSRLLWPAIALLMIVLASLMFDRFRQSRYTKKRIKIKGKVEAISVKTNNQNAANLTHYYSSIPLVQYSSKIIPLITAELRLSLKEFKPIWYLIGIALILCEIFVPFDISRRYLVPAAMIWPLILWSSIGTRETRFNTYLLMFSSTGVHSRQYISLLSSGIVIAIVMCSPMIIRAAIVGEYTYLMLILSSAFLLPSSALALGVISGSRKLFEVIYPLIWYIGSIDNIKMIDLLGTTSESTNLTRVLIFLTIAMGSAVVAYIVRNRKSLN